MTHAIFEESWNLASKRRLLTPITISEQISLPDAQCFHVFVCCEQNMVRSILLQVAGGRQNAQVPVCHISIFHSRFQHVFQGYHVIILHQQLKCHLGKLEQCVGSPWISFVASRSQNRSIENWVRGFHHEEIWFSRCLGINTRTL